MSIPERIETWLRRQPSPVLRAVIDRCDELLISLDDEDSPVSKSKTARQVLERQPKGAVTFQKERVPCGKHCSKCPHGPYWYAYWKCKGRSATAYINAGEALDLNRAAIILSNRDGADVSRWHVAIKHEQIGNKNDLAGPAAEARS